VAFSEFNKGLRLGLKKDNYGVDGIAVLELLGERMVSQRYARLLLVVS
jgi:hypothetical protein